MPQITQKNTYIWNSGATVALAGSLPWLTNVTRIYAPSTTGSTTQSYAQTGGVWGGTLASAGLRQGKGYWIISTSNSPNWTLPLDCIVLYEGVTIPTGPVANQLPTASLFLSSPSAQPGGSVTLTASASDPDGTISKVEYYNGSSKIGESFTGPSYSYVYSGLAAGSYALTARAFDNAGGFTNSAAQSLSVQAVANQLPTVSLFLSSNSAQPGGAVTLTATANDPDGSITRVDYYNGTSKIGESFNGPAFSFSYSNLVAGSYALTARAFDNSGAFTNSAAQSLSVQAAANQLPSISLVASSASITAGSAVNLTATASDPDGSISQVQFYSGSTELATDLTSPYTYSYTPPAAGSYALTAKATDNAGGFATSASVALTVTASVTQLASPAPSNPTNVSFDSFTQGWTQIANNSGYDVQYSTDSSFPDTAATTTLQVSTNTISRVIGGLAATTQYYVRVRARGTGSFSSSLYSGFVTATTLAVPSGTITLSAPTGSAVAEGQQALRVTGSTVSSATGYRLFRSATSNGTYTQTGGTLGVVNYLDTNLLDQTQYFYKWQAVGNGSNVQDSTLASATPFSGTTAAALPAYAAPYAPAVDDNANLFDWTPDSNATPLSEFEVSILGGTPVTVTSKPFNVGNLDIPAGGVGVRRKASATNSASVYLYNTVPFSSLFDAPQAGSLTGWASLTNYEKLIVYDAASSLPLTTLTSSAAAGATSVSVASTTGIIPTSMLYAGAEKVTVASVSGSTLTLASPLSSAIASGATVAHCLLQRVNESRTSAAGAPAVVATVADAVKTYYNHATGIYSAETTGSATSSIDLNHFITNQNTVFLTAEIDPASGPGYLLKSDVSGSPGLIYNYSPGLLQTYLWPSTGTIKANPTERFSLAIVRGATSTKVYYTDAQTPTAVVLDLPNGDTWASRPIIRLGDELKIRLQEYAVYGGVALSETDLLSWMTYMRNRYLGGGGSGNGNFSPDFSSDFN